LEKNKQAIDQKITLFRNNVEEYTRFFVNELKKQMKRINNDIENFKQSLFIEEFSSIEKNRYSINKTNRSHDTEVKKQLDNSNGLNNFIKPDEKKNNLKKDLSINSISEMKTETAGKCKVFLTVS
jgi:hypothetical protein